MSLLSVKLSKILDRTNIDIWNYGHMNSKKAFISFDILSSMNQNFIAS